MRKIYTLLTLVVVAFVLIACDQANDQDSKKFQEMFDDVTFIFQGEDSEDSVTQDVELPEYSDVEDAADFYWESSHPNIMNEYGKISRPNETTKVTMTLYIEFNNKEQHKKYTFNVIKKDLKTQWQLGDGENKEVIANRKLVFQDEFEGSSVDQTKWLFQEGNGTEYGLNDGWGNDETQWYTRDNAEVSNGTLKIHLRYDPERKNDGKWYTSARLATLGKHAQTYGRIEARIRVTSGDGVWPAFWMMPQDSEHGAWPLSGEIDIMEAQGRVPNKATSALHHTFAGRQDSGSYFFEKTTIRNYHVYAVEWQSGKIEFSVNGYVYKTHNMSHPFNRDFYIILNLAYGGKFDPSQVLNPAEDLPATMEIDWVRAYEGLSK